MANEFVIKNGFHSKGDSQVTGSLNVSGSITGSLFGSASYALTASYVNPTFISASAAASGFGAGGGSGAGFPYTGNAVITGSLLVSQSGLFVTGTFSTNQDAVVNNIDIGLGLGSSATNIRLGTDALDSTTPGTVGGYDVGRYNSAIGYQALQNNKSGSFNTAIGYNALNTVGSGSFDKVTNYTLLDATSNTAIGYYAGYKLESGSRNIAVGTNAMYNNKNAASNIAIGYNSMFYYASGSSFSLVDVNRKNIAIGENSLRGSATLQNTSENNIAIGASALINCTTGRYNIGIGTNTLSGNPLTGESNIAIGLQALQVNTSGYSNVGVGPNALNNNTTGFQNVAIGPNALKRNTTGQSNVAIGVGAYEFGTNDRVGNVAIGVEAMRYVTSSNNVAIGYQAMYRTSQYAQYTVAIGYGALFGDTTSGNAGQFNNAIGYQALNSAKNVGNTTAIGPQSLQYLNTGTNNTAIGYWSLQNALSGSDNTVIGREAGRNAKYVESIIAIGSNAATNMWGNTPDTAQSRDVVSIAIGRNALAGSSIIANNVGVNNIAIGGYALAGISTGSYNIAIGPSAMLSNVSSSYNIAIGQQALNTDPNAQRNIVMGFQAAYVVTGSDNVAIGYQALKHQYAGFTLVGPSSRNTAIGTQAGMAVYSGSGNVFIGYRAGPIPGGYTGNNANTSISNKLYIHNSDGNPLIGGDFSAKTVTISGSLYISGSIIPNADATMTSSFELGSPTAAWNRIWVRSSSIHFVDDSGNELAKISANPAGAIEMPSIYTSGTFTAQTFVTQSTTTIIEVFHATGSNKFGSSSLDTHQFTGSVYISGGLEQTAGNVSLRNTTINGSFTATGSVSLTGIESSNQSYLVSINPGTGQLYYTASSAFQPYNPDLSNYAQLTGSNIFAGEQEIKDANYILAIRATTTDRKLYDDSAIASINWDNRTLRDVSNITSIDYGSRQLVDQSGTNTLEYYDGQISIPVSFKLPNLTIAGAGTSSIVVQDLTSGQLYYTSSTAFVGAPGTNGASAYEIWLQQPGNSGTEEDFLNSLQGTAGITITDLFVNISESLWNTTSSIQFSGSVNSLYGYTGSLFGTATSASYIDPVYISASAASYGFGTGGGSTDISALNTFTGSIQTQVNNLTAATSSYITNSVTASMLNPYVLTSSTSSMSVLSSSYALTASYALNVPAIDTSALIGTASFNSFTSSIQSQVNNLVVATSSYVVNSITSSMLAPYTLLSVTSSMTVLSASYASSASYYNGSVTSASYAVTASYISPNFISASAAASGFSSGTDISALNTFTGSIQTQVDNLTSATSSYITNSITSSMSVLSSSYAATASYVVNALSSSVAASAGTASLVSTVGTNTGATYHVNFSTLASSYTGPIYTDAGGGLTFNPGSNILSTVNISATSITGSLRGHVVTSSINTSQSVLINSLGTAVDWANSSLGYSGVTSVNWASRYLINNTNNTTVDWQNGMLNDQSGYISVAWLDRTLRDSSGVGSIGYSSRALQDSIGATALSYATQNKVYTFGPLTTKLTPGFLAETEDSASPNYYAGEMYSAGENYPAPANQYGELIYLDYTTNAWVNIDQTTNVCTRYIGIDLDSKDGVLTEGHIVMTDAADPFNPSVPQIENPLIGMPVYIKEGSTGAFDSYTCNIPTSGYVRVIGHVMYRAVTSGYETKYMIKFKPSNDWYEI